MAAWLRGDCRWRAPGDLALGDLLPHSCRPSVFATRARTLGTAPRRPRRCAVLHGPLAGPRRAPLAPFGRWFDTLRLVRRFWPTLKSYTLGDLVRTFGLQARVDALCPDRTWHDALYDACAGAALFAHVLHVAGWDVVRGEAV